MSGLKIKKIRIAYRYDVFGFGNPRSGPPRYSRILPRKSGDIFLTVNEQENEQEEEKEDDRRMSRKKSKRMSRRIKRSKIRKKSGG